MNICWTLCSSVSMQTRAIDGGARRREMTHLTAEFDEARTHLAQRQAIVFAKVRDGLVIWSEPTQQPHHLDIASGFSFEPPARLYPQRVEGARPGMGSACS
jgi:hypothetical protein